jgi:hypothetical protein
MPSAGITLKQTDIPFLAGVSSTFTAGVRTAMQA